MGRILIWNIDRKFIREIKCPHRVDSVCFYNNSGDLLISHEQRVSFLAYKDYKMGIFKTIMDHPPFAGPRRNLVSDELLEELKVRDEQTREIKTGP